ncbi:hypothetical protein KY290_032940 [Solanum tuberosum]|uniref:MULE transposase domain-containing protein n=1 Tax=Solanum tuberosum TaxID=4113 RepID=A0ABQ7UF84_SOLTU|nr:hypothetical protein KY284_031935 [Solanum tuberosum]KAH0654648.1 hypothetical protein KY289_032326 [Solanum tuberosum]KAH0656857.1 hypothetical protein KY285_031739 [Solanum tuberosum]KAH0744947.1 hypothetical protein KY290_032940 [Solanum tuberosum]
MAVAEFVVNGGDCMGVCEETLKSWYWKSFSKTIVPIVLRHNGSYGDMIASVIEAGELTCEPDNLVISYQMNGRRKIHPTFIKNDRHVSLYMMDIVADGSRPILRINVIARSLIEPTYSFNDNDSIVKENLGDKPNESFCDQSHDNFGDDSMNGHDPSLDVEDQPVDAEDFKHFEEYEGEPELRSQPNHSFSDGTNFYMYQTFSTKSELQLLLAEATARKSFDFATVKSCGKYLKVKCVSRICAWMLRAKKYECSDRFRIYKYIGDHSCSVEHAINNHRKLSIKVIASLCVNIYRDDKGPNVKEIQMTIFNIFHCSPSYWKYWKRDFGACIKGSSHMRKVIAVDDTHLHGKYEGVLLSAVAQDTENHVYPIDFCVVDKENDASWTLFFEKLKVYNHAHHRYCMRHLGENLWINHQCGDSLYLYYNATKAYSLEEFNDHFLEVKDISPEAAFVLENDVGFEKWSRAHFPGNMYDVMTTNIAESLNTMLIDEIEYPMTSIFNSIAKRFGELFRARHAYVLKSKENITGMSINSPCLVQILLPLLTYWKSHVLVVNIVPIESEWCVPEELLSVNILPTLVDTKLGRKKIKCVKGVDYLGLHIGVFSDLWGAPMRGKPPKGNGLSLKLLFDVRGIFHGPFGRVNYEIPEAAFRSCTEGKNSRVVNLEHTWFGLSFYPYTHYLTFHFTGWLTYWWVIEGATMT